MDRRPKGTISGGTLYEASEAALYTQDAPTGTLAHGGTNALLVKRPATEVAANNGWMRINQQGLSTVTDWSVSTPVATETDYYGALTPTMRIRGNYLFHLSGQFVGAVVGGNTTYLVGHWQLWPQMSLDGAAWVDVDNSQTVDVGLASNGNLGAYTIYSQCPISCFAVCDARPVPRTVAFRVRIRPQHGAISGNTTRLDYIKLNVLPLANWTNEP